MTKIYTYGKQYIDEADKNAVMEALESDFLTCGSKIKEFEDALCAYTGARYAVVVSSATAGLHLAMMALGLDDNDEVITSPITFLATANCIMHAKAKPVFVDIEHDTANIDILEIEKHITSKTKAILPVHFAGQSCDMEPLHALAQKHGLYVIEDAAHAIGSYYKGNAVGSCTYSDMTVFSFHPVKTITTGEGGAITTNNPEIYTTLLALRSHGMHKTGAMEHTWEYEMRELGFNYRMTDIQASLGISQLRKLEQFKLRRREIVHYYNTHLNLPHLVERAYSDACFHLYPILVEDREKVYTQAKNKGLLLQVHYIPIHTQPFYKNLGYAHIKCPKAEEYYKKCISLPLYPSLTDEDVFEIVSRIKDILRGYIL